MRYKRPDKKNALSLAEAAQRELNFTLKLELNEESASTIIRNIYESFRMLGDAILVSQGLESDDHVKPISTLMSVKVNTPRPLAALDNYRRLRHNINYYGYKPSIKEAEDMIDFAKKCFDSLAQAILKEIK